MSASTEQRALLALSMLGAGPPRSLLDDIFSGRLHWPWIFMQAMHHRTLCILWENLKSQGLMEAAARSGLSKNWIAYGEQLCRASQQKNVLWLDILERIFARLNAAGIPAVAIKGSALIGDIYHAGNRMLGDIDILTARSSRGPAAALLHEMGLKHGTLDPISGVVKPMSRNKARFWSLHSHIMPKFTLATGNPEIPFFRLAVGFDFFDPGDTHSVPSEQVLLRRISWQPTSHLSVPHAADTIINLCAHIYREAISATFAFAGENWHLWKFCDLRTFLLAHGDPGTRAALLERLAQFELAKPYYFSVHYLAAIFGDPWLDEWLNLCDPGSDMTFLHEMVDGSRRMTYARPFSERLFDLHPTVVPGLEPVWAKVMQNGEWW